MNESFTDMSIYDKLQINGETLPFYNSLSENTIKGWMYSPVTGGGTANVEYEFLTGNSTAFLPSGTVPYQLYVKDRQASLVSLMSELGYETTAFHPYVSSGWNRPLVYSYMGFDHQIFEDDMQNPEYVRGYISVSYTHLDVYKRQAEWWRPILWTNSLTTPNTLTPDNCWKQQNNGKIKSLRWGANFFAFLFW